MHYVYALYSKDFDKIYIGYSSDINKRLAAHNHKNNTHWTAKFQPWIIVYSEEYDSKTLALKREKQLKSYRGRQFIRELIAGKY
ncbi:MAG: GIY-YIG nuclease family protein [Draconibacterium sp.]|jgi:putative endonuclease